MSDADLEYAPQGENKMFSPCYFCQRLAIIYRAALDEPIRFIVPLFTMAPRTASTVVGLTSGRSLQISALESGVRLFNIVASMRAFFVIFFP